MLDVELSVKGNTCTTAITSSGVGIYPAPSNHVAVIELSTVSVADVLLLVPALSTSACVI
jgi:hypothetical protein